MKKGFTLVELLAVIVILAIIALITVPQVINIINNGNIQALKFSKESIIKSISNYTDEKEIDGIILDSLIVECKSNKCIVIKECSEEECISVNNKIDVSGKLPVGIIDVSLNSNNNYIYNYSLYDSGYCYSNDVLKKSNEDSCSVYYNYVINNYNITGKDDKYQEVEYIESSGIQYIDSGYKINTLLDKIETELSVTRQSGSHLVFGYYSVDGNHYGYNYYNTGNYIDIYFNNVGKEFSYYNYVSEKHLVKYNGNEVYINNKNVYSADIELKNFNFSKTMPIFASWYSNNISFFITMKLYNFKILRNGQIQKNFIPCYEKDNPDNAGLFDLITHEFHPNKGDGKFTYGNSINRTLGTLDSLTSKYKIIIKLSGDNIETKYYNIYTTYPLLVGERIDYSKQAVLNIDGTIKENIAVPSILKNTSNVKLEVIDSNTNTEIIIN